MEIIALNSYLQPSLWRLPWICISHTKIGEGKKKFSHTGETQLSISISLLLILNILKITLCFC